MCSVEMNYNTKDMVLNADFSPALAAAPYTGQGHELPLVNLRHTMWQVTGKVTTAPVGFHVHG